jgi:dienelactone hydrolase
MSRRTVTAIALALAWTVVVMAVGYRVGRGWRPGFLQSTATEPAVEDSTRRLLPDSLRGIDTRAFAQVEAYLLDQVDSARDAGSLVPFDLAGVDADSLSRIKRSVRAELEKVFPPWTGDRPAFDPVDVPWYRADGVVARLVSIEGALPTIVFLHGNNGTLDDLASDIDYHHGIAHALAQRGIQVIAPQVADSRPLLRVPLHLLAIWTGTTINSVTQSILERTVDWASSTPDVDPDRLGVYGISAGGERALLLGALDERFSMVLLSGYLTDRFGHWYGFAEEIQPLHLLRAIPDAGVAFDDMNYVALVHPRWFGVEIGRSDPRSEPSGMVYSRVEELYASTGHADRTSYLPFDGGHTTNLGSAFPFIERWLESGPTDERIP